MEHFPLRIGWLFHKDTDGDTPFQEASTKYEKEKIQTILDEALNNHQSSQHEENFMLKSYVIAASDESVDVECDFLLLRRDPSDSLATAEAATAIIITIIITIVASMQEQQIQEVVEATEKTTTTYLISGAVLRQGKKRKRNTATTFFDTM
eukprot:CAMPEP_0170997836 /NCGR_PEP_ID=MMETSP0736-20130129/13100_1 /TAXON_ID=186038 /ORGANISM="Fragilariopsis kerguelensis, Strain L26-C5" /LENGTH=150 /DNA_ID=CAMNT_0011424609 /DNA_START=218 /DNA_END=669 /DNA_ORIENTATION=-